MYRKRIKISYAEKHIPKIVAVIACRLIKNLIIKNSLITCVILAKNKSDIEGVITDNQLIYPTTIVLFILRLCN